MLDKMEIVNKWIIFVLNFISIWGFFLLRFDSDYLEVYGLFKNMIIIIYSGLENVCIFKENLYIRLGILFGFFIFCIIMDFFEIYL